MTLLTDHSGQQLEAEQLRSWLDGSCVVDPVHGGPLTVYHGTNRQFMQFDIGQAQSGLGIVESGIYFSSSPAVASIYASIRGREGAQVIPAFLALKNPLVADFGQAPGTTPPGPWRSKMFALARQEKRDGIIFKGMPDLGGDAMQYVVFSSAQIKFAIPNAPVAAQMVRGAKPAVDDRGRRLGESPDAIDAFWSWFGASRVVQNEGRPLMLFHGTPNGGFTSFSPESRGARTGHSCEDVAFHFTDSPSYAEAYSEAYHIEAIETYRQHFGEEPKGIKMPPGGATYPVYLKMDNPLEVDRSLLINAELIAQAKAAGHDSIIAGLGGSKEYVVFDPRQIKSATGNSGLFLKDSADLVDAPAMAPSLRAHASAQLLIATAQAEIGGDRDSRRAAVLGL